MSLVIIKPGLNTLIQDYGRYGYQHLGVTSGGPIDSKAFLWANYLLDNYYANTQLEICYGGFSCEFTENTTITLCGADLCSTLDGVSISSWHTYAVHSGSVLECTHAKRGMYAYLAVKGGFEVAPKLSSASTVVREGLGGIGKGTPLAKGDHIRYTSSSHTHSRSMPHEHKDNYDEKIILRYFPNTTLSFISKEAQYILNNSTYSVSTTINRMGYRLCGTHNTKIPTHRDNTYISQGISLGAIQIPPDGQPIILLQDRQTIGGYPIAGCVAKLDLPLLAQSAPQTQVVFQPADAQILGNEWRLFQQFFMQHTSTAK